MDDVNPSVLVPNSEVGGPSVVRSVPVGIASVAVGSKEDPSFDVNRSRGVRQGPEELLPLMAEAVQRVPFSPA